MRPLVGVKETKMRPISAIEDLIVWVGGVPLILSRMTRRQQAILAWCATADYHYRLVAVTITEWSGNCSKN